MKIISSPNARALVFNWGHIGFNILTKSFYILGISFGFCESPDGAAFGIFISIALFQFHIAVNV